MAAPAARERANSDGRGGRGPAGSAASVAGVANDEGAFPAPRRRRVPPVPRGAASRPAGSLTLLGHSLLGRPSAGSSSGGPGGGASRGSDTGRCGRNAALETEAASPT